MAFNLESISVGKIIKAPRIVILGVEKIGKTSFACGTKFKDGKINGYGENAPIGIPVKGETGMDDMDIPKFPTSESFANVMQAVSSLYSEDHEYKTAVIDSASAMEPLVWDAVCALHNVKSIEEVSGGYGKGYMEALSLWREFLDGLDALQSHKNMASIIIGHVKVKRFDDPNGESYDQYQFDINDKAANLLFRWADQILFCNTKVVVKKEDKGFGAKKSRGIDIENGRRFLYTQKRPAHPGGGRGIYGQLPYELPLEWEAFQAAIAELI